jgi:hypothetical protein
MEQTYVYARDGERFAIGTESGVLYESAEAAAVEWNPALAGTRARRVLAHISGPLPAEVVASTVIELALAGWTPAEMTK